MEPFALLDDARAGRATLLTHLRHTARVTLDTVDEELRRGWDRGWHCLAWLPYDLGEAHLGVRPGGAGALYWFADRTPADPEGWLATGSAWLANPGHDVDQQRFSTTVDRLHRAIADGTAYQVNYTHRVHARAVGDPRALYARLRRRQPVEFGVLAHLPGPAAPWTLSLSPELFLHVEAGTVMSRPMKGTAPSDDPPSTLSDDPKNRAENLMIVDLIRNDLSRVALPGTVEVPRLFEVERVGQLWQMTSTVRAELAPGTTPGQVLAATFPCGSITGAPKLSSMGLIRDTELDRRGLYTGSLGVIEPSDGPLGWTMTLSVAIRTLEIDDDGSATLGVGSGIVADSTAETEWAECRAKGGFATALEPDVALIETMRVVDGQAPLLARHEARLAASAAALGFPAPGDAVAEAVRGTPAGSWRVRLQLSFSGEVSVTRSPLAHTAAPVSVRLDERPWPPNALAAHKTTGRPVMDAAVATAERWGVFDVIGFDARRRVLEGGRSNVFARVDGRWVTPPVNVGLLPGTQRDEVLAHPELIGATHIDERVVTVDELLRAEAIVVTNAVRGVLNARLEDAP
ncbi:bifunctional chorismate-binding protein/class IV aminotransferase [Tessaracoccus flavus]|uniref:bifunctional chorismate-binding protein/class IV aminotransferase n=2 Tax=Tessaracoccus flavus TaxID=1610493 RepID=UPI000897C164|nr:bifunctional chorismate-binding protein/class IV aminotransferase [Tessaracoccus flavus]SDY36850.1 para-aminobenzoate synthetase / 4-amino-4-deoxychorismate lyase [Tessaracoccus flavus]